MNEVARKGQEQNKPLPPHPRPSAALAFPLSHPLYLAFNKALKRIRAGSKVGYSKASAMAYLRKKLRPLQI